MEQIVSINIPSMHTEPVWYDLKLTEFRTQSHQTWPKPNAEAKVGHEVGVATLGAAEVGREVGHSLSCCSMRRSDTWCSRGRP